MKKLLLAMSVVAAQISVAATTCIVGGWPIVGTQTASTGSVQNVVWGDILRMPALLACQIDTRAIFESYAPIDVLDTTKVGGVLIIR